MELERKLIELRQMCDWLRGDNERLVSQIHHLEEQSRSLRKDSEEKEEKVIKLENEPENKASWMKQTEERYRGKYENLSKELESEKRKWKEEVEIVGKKSLHLDVDARKLEFDLQAERRALSELKVEFEALKSEMKQKEGVITTLIRKNEVLEREKTRVEDRFAKMKPVSSSVNVSELVEKVRVLEREKGNIEAKFCKIENDKCAEIKRILQERLVFEDEKRRVMADMKEEIDQLVQRIGVLDREKREMGAEFSKMRKGMSAEIDMILNEKMSLEAENKRMEEKLRIEAQRIEVLESEKAMEVQWNGILEREIGGMKAEISKAVEAEKRKVKEEEEKNLELVQKVGILEREKAEVEANALKAKRDKGNEPEVKMAVVSRRIEEARRKISELHRKVEALEKVKDAMQAELLRVYREKGKEIKRILKEKTDVEAGKRSMEEVDKKKIIGLFSRIEAFESEKRGMEAMIRQANSAKIEEAKRVSMVKEEAEKKMSELVHRIGVLESEKQGLMAANTEKDEVIKVLEKESEKFYARKAEISGDASIQNTDANAVKRPSKILRLG